MSYAPASISALAAYWMAHKGVNSGIVGGAGHTRGYHLGKDRIFGTGGQGWADYSVKTARDKAGLTNAASALDLGRLNGSLPQLQKFSVWLVGRCRANAPGTSDVREIIYSPDGVHVYGWNRENGYASKPIIGYSDSSHLWHTHISFYRDSERRDKVGLFAPFWTLPDSSTEDIPMPSLSVYIPGHQAIVKAADGANVRSAPLVAAPKLRTIPAGSSETWNVTGWVKGDLSDGSDQWLVRWALTRWEYVHKVNVASVGIPAPDCTAAVAAATAPIRAEVAAVTARLAGVKTKTAAFAADIAND
jgi:hypothetical protein